MDFWASLVAEPEPAELVQPGDRALHDPPDLPDSPVALLVAHGDDRLDAAPAKANSDLGRVVGFVGGERLRSFSWSPPRAPDRADRVHQGERRLGVVRVGPRELDGKRHPAPVGQNVPLRARFRPPKTAPRRRGIHRRPLPIDLALRAEPVQEDLVVLLPDPRPVPVSEASPTGYPTSTAHLLRQALLRDALRSTYRITARHALSGTRARPPLGFGGSGGRSGLISSHSSSGRITFPKAAPPFALEMLPVVSKSQPQSQGFERGSYNRCM